MNITRADIDALNATLTVKVEKPDYEPKVEATLRDYRRKAQIPGFRPGMVPMGVIRKMYQKAITTDEVLKQVSSGITQYIEDNRLHVLGDPLPNKDTQLVDFDTQSEFEFTYDVALAPEVRLDIDKKITIPYYNVILTEDEVQQRIETYRTYYGKAINAEKVEKNDLLKVDLAQDKTDGYSVNETLLSLKVIPEAEQQVLLGLSAGESVEVNVRNMLTNDVDCAAFLRVSKKQLEAIDPVFTLTIKEIMHVEPAEINQNFFDELYGKDAVTSEDVFAEKVRDEINNEMASKSEHRFVTDVRNLLLQRAALELPEVFLKRWLLLTSEGKLTKEELEKEFPAFAENLRWQLIEEHILKEGNIELKEEDLLFVARQMVLRRLAMYGVNNMIEERLTEFARTMLNRSEDRSTIAKLAAEHRVIEYVRDTVTVEKKEVSHEHLKSLLAAS